MLPAHAARHRPHRHGIADGAGPCHPAAAGRRGSDDGAGSHRRSVPNPRRSPVTEGAAARGQKRRRGTTRSPCLRGERRFRRLMYHTRAMIEGTLPTFRAFCPDGDHGVAFCPNGVIRGYDWQPNWQTETDQYRTDQSLLSATSDRSALGSGGQSKSCLSR